MKIRTVFTTACLALGLCVGSPVLASSDAVCIPVGQWQAPGSGTPLAIDALTTRLAQAPVVLLGESHTNRDDHRWQLQMLAALHAKNPNMVIGFEAFPRAAQPVLDQWIQGSLSEKDFLRAVDWNTVWRFDPSLYMDLFHFARLNRIPMVPMNVERSVISNIRKKGWNDVPAHERQGITTPATPPAAYIASLADIYAEHLLPRKKGEDKPPAPTLDDPAFRGFVDAQAAWDRAMAQALASAQGGTKGTLVIGIVGRGHLEYGHGIPFQLADLGISDSRVLLPWQPGRPCDDLALNDGTPVATAVFGIHHVPETAKPAKPKLGVMIETAPKDGPAGVLVRHVVADSVAAKAGLLENDIIEQAAGQSVNDIASLIAIITQQAPGTWLPLRVQRSGAVVNVVAKFPGLTSTEP